MACTGNADCGMHLPKCDTVCKGKIPLDFYQLPISILILIGKMAAGRITAVCKRNVILHSPSSGLVNIFCYQM